MNSLISLVGPGDAGIIRVTSFEQLDRLSVIGQSETLRQYANQLIQLMNEICEKLPTCE